tara:strand:- start:53 stop:439 length:387 start_codon:yes stop_codon:yes gene_type:complete
MKNETDKNNDVKVSKKALYELFLDINDKLTHLEDASLDNRKLIAKLVKQGNSVVEFLKQFEVNEMDPSGVEIGMELPPLPSTDEKIKRTEDIKELIDDILERHQDLKDFEDELKKHKDKLTPGQVGES